MTLLSSHFSPMDTIYLLVYVDDIILTDNTKPLLKRLSQKSIQLSLSNTMVTLTIFLVLRSSKYLMDLLSKHKAKYLRDLLPKTNMLDSFSVNTHMYSTCKLTKIGFATLPDPYMYRSVVGGLQYVTITRPDITRAVNKVCQFMAHPLEIH